MQFRAVRAVSVFADDIDRIAAFALPERPERRRLAAGRARDHFGWAGAFDGFEIFEGFGFVQAAFALAGGEEEYDDQENVLLVECEARERGNAGETDITSDLQTSRWPDEEPQ